MTTPVGGGPDARARVGATLDPRWRAAVDPAWLEGWTPRAFDLGDGVTDVVVMGEGPPLVLMPPLPGYKEAWLAVAAPLARTHRVVAFDLRRRFPGRPSWDIVRRDLERLLDAEAPGRAVVIGHSMGGALAQQWALARPERVRALVLSSSFLRLRNPAGNLYARFVEQPLLVASQRLLPDAAALSLARVMARHGRWVYDARCDDRLLSFVRHCMRHTDAATVRSAVALVLAHDSTTTAAALRAPALVIVGERESVFSRPAARELARVIPGAALRESPGASHLHPLSSPEWFVATVTEWLARLPEPTGPESRTSGRRD
jgi:pimeloyl-ACP methyl ester carboxylesterase